MFYVSYIPWQKVLYLHYFFHCILWYFIVLGLVLSWWRIEHEMKNQCNVVTNSQEKYLVKRAHEKHMLEAEESCLTIVFTSHVRPSREILAKCSASRILSMTFLPFTHTIYTLITHKSMRDHSKRKTLDSFSTTQHTHLFERELLILSEKSF